MLLVAIVTGASAATETVFSMSGVNGVTTGTLDTDYTVEGDVISVIHKKTIGLSATYTNGTAEVFNGHKSKDNLTVNTKTGVINIGNSGSSYVCITLTSGTIQEGDVISIDEQSEKSEKLGPSSSSLSELTVPYTVAPGSALINSNKLYIAKSDIATFSSVTITRTPAGPVDPEFSLTKTSIGTNETSQIQVGTKGNLDGITFNGDVSYGTEGVVTVSSTGLVTPVAPGSTTITFSTNAVDGKYNASSNKQVTITVTAPTYAVNYDLNGGSGDAPTQDPQEAGAKFNLATAPTKDFTNFAGWLCSADDQVYEAGAAYTMTAAPTTFTAQWSGTTYSSTLDFAAKTLAGETSGTLAEFLATGNMICSGIATRSAWETQTTDKKVGFWGYKLKDINATVKFMVQAGKRVTITLGSIGATTTLKKNGVSESVSTNSGDYKQNVITFDADVDMLVEIVVGEDNKTVTLNKIAIEDAIAATNVTVGTTGFATIGLPYATTLPEGVTAYAVSSVEGSKVVMSEAIAAETVIPANRGLVIVADPANSPYAFAEFVGTQQFDLSGNELKATGINEKAATEQAPIYVLTITDAQKQKIGFKKATTGKLGAYKAYLPGTVSTLTSLSASFDEETAINGIAESEANAEAPVKVIKNGKLFIGNYNVAGQQVK